MDYQPDLTELLKPIPEDRDSELLPRGESNLDEIDRISKEMVAGRKQQARMRRNVSQFNSLRWEAKKTTKRLHHGFNSRN